MKNRFFLALTALMLTCATAAVAEGVDESHRLINGDCESGLKGWNVTFTRDMNTNGYTWKSSRHTEAGGDDGYYGFYDHCLEIWGGSKEVGPNSISQVVRNLANGTYVFGANMVAAIQSTESRTEENKDDVDEVYIFAGDQKLATRTNNPSASSNYDWGHAWKFNVAATVTDGTLRVGVCAEQGTNVTFICLDNMTLWYFGDMEPDEALLAMRRNDIARVTAFCEELKGTAMEATLRARMEEAMKVAAAATTLEEAEAAEEELRLAKKLAVRSVEAYKPLAALLVEAQTVAAGEWSVEVADYVASLKELMARCAQDYADGALDKDGVASTMSELQNAIDLVKVDDLWVMLDELELFVNRWEEIGEDNPSIFVGTSHPGFGDELGQFPAEQADVLAALIEEVQTVLTQVDNGEIAATEAVKYIDKVRKAVANCIALRQTGNVLPLTLITIPAADGSAFRIENNGVPSLDVFVQQLKSVGVEPVESECSPGVNVFRYESPVIMLGEHVDKVRFSVVSTLLTVPGNKAYPYGRAHNSCNCGPYFNINELYFYDVNGEQINITADLLSTNAQQGNEGPITGIVDGIIDGTGTTFFHSCYSGGTHPESGNHYIELEVPEGLTEFSIAFEVIWDNRYRLANLPVTIYVEEVSNLRSSLDALLLEADAYNPVKGDDPGFYNTDCSAFFAARDEAKAISANSESTDAEMIAAMEKLEELIPTAAAAVQLKPEVGVEYCITSACPFFDKQQVVKNMTVQPFTIAEDTTVNMLRWNTANAADPMQRFVFEYVGSYDKYTTVVIKNVGTGEYVGNFVGGYPGLSNQGFSFTEVTEHPDTLRMEDLGGGQWIIYGYGGTGARYTGWMGFHCGDHNNGDYSTNTGVYGQSVYGQQGAIVQYNTGADNASAWYIRRMSEMPLTETVEGESVKTRTLHFDGPIKSFTLTGDKACAFDGLRIYDLKSKEMGFSASGNFFTTTVTLDEVHESFSIAFNNPEGITALTLTGGVSRLSKLAEAYEAVASKGYEEGSDVGCIKDLSALNKAMADAAKMLEDGMADDEAIDAAIQALADAEAGLQAVEPDPTKTYFLVSAYAPFEQNWGTEMAIFEDEVNGILGWTYLGIDDSRFEWQFEPVTGVDGDTEGCFYIMNAGSENYIGTAAGTGRSNPIVMNLTAKEYYKLMPRAGRTFNILNVSTEGADGSWMFHPGYHDEGTRPFANVCFFGNEAVTKSEWYIREAGAVRMATDIVRLEETQPERTASGIFDLTGRRVSNPEKGIYIISGRKVLVR